MRLFIGLPLSCPAQENTAALAARAQSVIPGRYVLASNYHMTLAFLGDTPGERLHEVRQVLDAFAAQFPPPRLTLDALSHFGREQNAILVRSVSSPDALDAMHEYLLSALRLRGLPVTDGPFTPHVTLARHADLTAEMPPAAPSFSFCAPHAVLYLSARDEENILRYTPLHRAAFRILP